MPGRQSSRKLSMQSLEARYALDGDPLGNGEEIRREVGQEDPFDEFYFDAQAGDLVWLALQEERPKSDSQVELTIRTPSGDRIYDWGGDSAFEYFQAGESGRFQVFVSERGNEQDFDYKLRFITQPGSVAFTYDQDATLDRGETHGSSLPAGSLSVIFFEAIAGTTVFTSMGETFAQGANPRMWLFDSAGSLVTVVSDEVAFTEEFVAPSTGEYTAIVGDFDSNEPLSYTFSLATLPGEVDYDLPQNVFLRSGERHTGSIAVGEQHLVQFNADAGSRVFATLGEVGNQNANPRIRIVDPNGQVVGGTTVSDEYGLQIGFDAPITGLYTAVISDFDSNEPLSYTFRQNAFAHQPDSLEQFESALINGAAQTGTLQLGDFAIHPFYVTGGATAEITLVEQGSSSAQVLLQVFDRSGYRVWNGSDTSLEEATIFSAEAGEYFAVVSESGSNSTLSYSIVASGVTAPFTALPGDYDGNQFVDERDRAFWADHYGSTEGRGLYADGNGDGRVDVADYTVWRDHLGAFVTPASPQVNLPEATHTSPQLALSGRVPENAGSLVGLSASPSVGTSPLIGGWVSEQTAEQDPINLAREAALLLIAGVDLDGREQFASEIRNRETYEAIRDEAFVHFEADFQPVPEKGMED